MDADLLSYPGELIPPGIDASLWLRYLKGTKAFDELWGKGERCSANPQGARCRCKKPVTHFCKIWVRLEELAKQIGRTEAEIMDRMN